MGVGLLGEGPIVGLPDHADGSAIVLAVIVLAVVVAISVATRSIKALLRERTETLNPNGGASMADKVQSSSQLITAVLENQHMMSDNLARIDRTMLQMQADHRELAAKLDGVAARTFG